MSRKLYNPRANAPAVYIPAWLSQVPNHELTYSCKLVYGRLAQWASHLGKAHRSANQLGQELGMPERTVENCIKELRDKELIGSSLPEDGGHNHYEFYDHEFMHRPINKHLCYKSDTYTPSADIAGGTASFAEGTATVAEHKIKEIKETNKERSDDAIASTQSTELAIIRQDPITVHLSDKYLLLQKTLNEQCMNDRKCLEAFDSKFSSLDVSIEEMLYECVMYYALQETAKHVSPHRFLAWVKREHVSTYTKKPDSLAHKLYRDLNDEEKVLISNYMHFKKYPDIGSLKMAEQHRAMQILDMLSKTKEMSIV